jgi:mRNA interferase RelE/StbE
MAWRIELTPRAERSLEKLDRQVSARILEYLYGRVATSKDPFAMGKPLLGPEHENMWRFRVEDYRILTRIQRDIVTVFVVEVGHRREIYR